MNYVKQKQEFYFHVSKKIVSKNRKGQKNVSIYTYFLLYLNNYLIYFLFDLWL